MRIEHAESDEQIAATFDVMRQLRPHLADHALAETLEGPLSLSWPPIAFFSAFIR